MIFYVHAKQCKTNGGASLLSANIIKPKMFDSPFKSPLKGPFKIPSEIPFECPFESPSESPFSE